MSLITLGLGLAGILNQWTAWGLIRVRRRRVLARIFPGFRGFLSLDRKTMDARLTDYVAERAETAHGFGFRR